jgi:hypothetical protein
MRASGKQSSALTSLELGCPSIRRNYSELDPRLFLPPAKMDTHSHPFTPDWRVRTVKVTTHNSIQL